MAGRPLLVLLSLLLVAGGIVLQLFVILSGAVSTTPINQVYFLEAGTDSIPGQRNPSRWTFFAVCGADENGRNTDCGAIVAALPFDPPHRTNFDTETGVPDGFIGTRKYYYLSRAAFAFFFIALLFAVGALFTGLLAVCARLGAYLSGLTTSVALFFQALAAALMTAWTVEARNTFRAASLDSKLGIKAYAFSWAAVACFFLATFLFCAGGRARHDQYVARSPGGRSFFFRRRRSHRDSYLDGHGRGVKDDYS